MIELEDEERRSKVIEDEKASGRERQENKEGRNKTNE